MKTIKTSELTKKATLIHDRRRGGDLIPFYRLTNGEVVDGRILATTGFPGWDNDEKMTEWDE